MNRNQIRFLLDEDTSHVIRKDLEYRAPIRHYCPFGNEGKTMRLLRKGEKPLGQREWRDPHKAFRLGEFEDELNTRYSRTDLRRDGFTITYSAVLEESTIYVEVDYLPNVNKAALNAAINEARGTISQLVKYYRWEKWLKVREKVNERYF